MEAVDGISQRCHSHTRQTNHPQTHHKEGYGDDLAHGGLDPPFQKPGKKQGASGRHYGQHRAEGGEGWLREGHRQQQKN